MRFIKELSRLCFPVLAWIAVGVLASSAGQAAVVFNGTVSPAASGDWNADTVCYVGQSGGSGTALINGGDALDSKYGYIGDSAGGTVTVDGSGSTWTIVPLWVEFPEIPGYGFYVHGEFYVGSGNGTGVLKITNGGAVSDHHATIAYGSSSSGAVELSDNSTWNTTEEFFVGSSGTGTLDILTGSTVTSNTGYIGGESGAVGVATVNGAGSLWENGENLFVGLGGTGTLNITGGGCVKVDGDAYVKEALGTIHFNGGTLEVAKSLFTKKTDLSGAGTINTKGLISDLDLTFDGAATCVNTFGTAGTLTVDMSSAAGDLGVGYDGDATLTIRNAATVSSVNGYIGYQSGSAGTATVSGSATWNTEQISVGYKDEGTLDITTCGTVSSLYGYIGHYTGSTGTVKVDGVGSAWKVIEIYDSEEEIEKGGDLTVGSSGDGSLSIVNGGFVSVDEKTTIGWRDGSTGVIHFNAGTLSTKTLYLDVAEPQLTGAGNLYTKGLVSDMNLTFDSTGDLSQSFMFPGSSVSVTLDMSDSSVQGDLGAGYRSNGSLLITNGVVLGSNDAPAKGFLGYNEGTSGTATVSESATWNCNDLFVGSSGIGTLNITGGTVNSAQATIGVMDTSRGTVTVNGSGSAWNISSSLSVADAGQSGWLCIYNGGFVGGSATTVSVGSSDSTAGVIRVRGEGSKLSAHSVRLGLGDSLSFGTLEIQNGGVVDVHGGNVQLGIHDSATGNIYFSGGTLRYSGTVSHSEWISVGDGEDHVYIESGGATFDVSHAVDVGIGVTLRVYGYSPGGGLTKTGAGTLTLSGDNTYTGLTCVNGGTLKLVDESSGWTGAFEPILTGGSASLGGGALLFNYSDTYDDATALSNIQAAITAGKIFAAYHTPPLLCSGNSATDIVTVMNTLYGDANVDGSVNGTDLNAVLSYYNQSGQAWANGDFNFDGSVNGTDLNTVLSNYNQSLSSSTAAVPEPSTLLLLVLGLLGLLAWRKLCF